MSKPWDHDISTKWPAARAIGPNVSAEQALDYVLRTDRSLLPYGVFCNDRQFERRLKNLIGINDDDRYDHELLDKYCEALNHVSLEFLDSNWVASAYIGGPHGLVSPLGSVSLAHNFGKWPSVSRIEEDLDAITTAFPWLTFSLWLWDDPEEDAAVTWGSDPTHAWEASDGMWRRVETEGACTGKNVPSSPDIESMALGFITGTRRETTWPIEDIDRLFGDRIRAAMAYAKKETQEPTE